LGGATHTRGWSRTNSKRQALFAAIAGATALAIVGAIVFQRNSPQKIDNQASSTSPVVQSATAWIPQSSLSPSAKTIDVKAPLSAEVTVTITGAPKNTKVFHGATEIGTLGTPLRLPRSDDKILLRFVADTFTPVEMELIPNVDQTLAVTMKPVRAGTTNPVKPKVPKELEAF
jgi:hypothetical protein